MCFLQTLGFAKYSLLGWSDGGTTALLFAARHPHRVRKLVAWGASSYITQPEVEFMEKHVKSPDSWSPRVRQPMVELYGEEYLQKLCAGWVDCFSKFYHQNEGE